MRPFRKIDVFGAATLIGNPLAVVHDAEGLSTEQMLAFTRWTNLSEVAFLLAPEAPGADYRVRIFTLAGELPFAGHPTLGSCHAWLEAGGEARDGAVVVQECGAGVLPIVGGGGGPVSPPPPLLRDGPVSQATLAEVVDILRISPDDIVASRWVDNGPGWLGVRLADAAAVLALDPSPVAGEVATDIGVIGSHAPGSDCAYEVRAFFSDAHGHLREDPVTGSLNASLAQWLLADGVIEAPLTASQGTVLGRRGRVAIDVDAQGQVWVGGSTVTVVAGQVAL
jgi:PhzF family phenazine biosynthesis protein